MLKSWWKRGPACSRRSDSAMRRAIPWPRAGPRRTSSRPRCTPAPSPTDRAGTRASPGSRPSSTRRVAFSRSFSRSTASSSVATPGIRTTYFVPPPPPGSSGWSDPRESARNLGVLLSPERDALQHLRRSTAGSSSVGSLSGGSVPIAGIVLHRSPDLRRHDLVEHVHARHSLPPPRASAGRYA